MTTQSAREPRTAAPQHGALMCATPFRNAVPPRRLQSSGGYVNMLPSTMSEVTPQHMALLQDLSGTCAAPRRAARLPSAPAIPGPSQSHCCKRMRGGGASASQA